MKIIKKILSIFALSIVIVTLTQSGTSFAEANNTSPSKAFLIDDSYRPINMAFNTDYVNRTAEDNTITIIQIIAGALLYLAIPATTIFVVYSGVQMVIYGNESDKIEEAKNNLKWALIGLLFIILSYSIVRIVIEITVRSGEAVGS